MINSFRFIPIIVTLTSFSSSTGGKNQSTTCGFSLNQTYYHDGDNAFPAIGDNVYSDSSGTAGLARNHYKISSLGTYHIQSGGTIVDSTSPCV